MKKIVGIVAALAIVMLMGTSAWAADATDAVGATVTGDPICTLSISSSDLTVSAPTGVGLSTTAFTNSPITLEITDNIVTPVSSANILTCIATSSEPVQYDDTGSIGAYWIHLDTATWTPAADNDVTPLSLSENWVSFSSAENIVNMGASPAGAILHGTVEIPTNLIIETDKRLYGDTSDSITIQFTLADN